MSRIVKSSAWVALLALGLCLASSSEARGKVGRKIPWFWLPSVTGGHHSPKTMAGKPAVLVVGTTKKGAPPCKVWMLNLIRKKGRAFPVYQVIVADKAWFLPKFLVMKEIKSFVPKAELRRVLVEWKTGFGDRLGIPKDDRPTVVMVDGKGVIRWWHRGAMTSVAQASLDDALAKAKSRPTKTAKQAVARKK